MSMTEQEEQFYRAELARTPRDFDGLNADQIGVILDARWRKSASSLVMLEDKLTEREAEENGVIFCGAIRRNGKMTHMYKNADVTQTVNASRKRPREDNGSSSTDWDMRSAIVGLECFLMNFKKDTLQRMCEDMQLAVSGNKHELMQRMMSVMQNPSV